MWESMYAALVEYKRAYGHCRVPAVSKDMPDCTIGSTRCVDIRRQGKLSEDRIRRLTELGFVWDGRQDRRASD